MNYDNVYSVISYPPYLALLFVAQGYGWRPKGYYHGLTEFRNSLVNTYTDEDCPEISTAQPVYESAAAIIEALELAIVDLSDEQGQSTIFEYQSQVHNRLIICSTTRRIKEFIRELKTLGRDEVAFDWPE